MRQKTTVGFSLVELLVVIGIMAILAGILLPVFFRMNQSEKSTICMENLHEIGVALTLYHDDFNAYPSAPRPDYLSNMNVQALPYTSLPAIAPAGWVEWQPTTSDPTSPYALQAHNPPTVGNFGLATMYYLFLTDQKDYLRSFKQYHCPLQLHTENVNRGAVLQAADLADPTVQNTKTFDPLWAGYNTYDVTYNYDQFQNSIIQYDDTVLGLNGSSASNQLDIVRQLHFGSAKPVSADTVVCWCYAHNGDGSASVNVIDPAPTSVVSPSNVQAAEQQRASQIYQVLWVDGSVQSVHPYLSLGVNGYYYWVPPFLYSRDHS